MDTFNVHTNNVRRREPRNNSNDSYLNSEDINNNTNYRLEPIRGSRPYRDSQDTTGIRGLPPITTSIALLTVTLHVLRLYVFELMEEDVSVSAKKVFQDKQWWRLFYAHYFHFHKIPLFVNCVTLVALGRYLEKKLTKIAVIVIIEIMGVLSNLIYISLAPLLCSNTQNSMVSGFTMVAFGLRIVLVYLKGNRRRFPSSAEPDLLFGFYPVHLPSSVATWQPVWETLMHEILVQNRCFVGNLAGMISATVILLTESPKLETYVYIQEYTQRFQRGLYTIAIDNPQSRLEYEDSLDLPPENPEGINNEGEDEFEDLEDEDNNDDVDVNNNTGE